MSFLQRYQFWRVDCKHGRFKSLRLACTIREDITMKFFKFNQLAKEAWNEKTQESNLAN